MMKSRLTMARDLLSPEGIIFISIDDNEQAYLKVIMDEIFGEENFMYNFCVKMKDGGVSGAQITNSHEYILMYTKNGKVRLDEKACQIKVKLEDWSKNNKIVYSGLTNEKYLQMKSIDIEEEGTFDTKIGSLEFIEKIGKELQMEHLKKYKYIFRFTNPQSTRSQRIIKCLHKDQFITWKVNSRKNKGSKTTYFGKTNEASSPLLFDKDGFILQKRSTIWTDISTAGLANEGGISFKNGKKPLKLIKNLINLHPNKNATILDFFAGSGTTGEATLSQNHEDGGNRKFILVTNNESNIAHEKTYARLKICSQRGLHTSDKNNNINKEVKVRIIDIDDSTSIALDGDVSNHLYEKCKMGLRALNSSYNKSGINLYYDLAALNPLEKKEDES